MGRVWLIGEQNPYSSERRYALFPYPKGSGGDRLCRILGMRRLDFARSFGRRNVVEEARWTDAEALSSAAFMVLGEFKSEDVVILLGKKVYDCFKTVAGLPKKWEVLTGFRERIQPQYLFLPHPSGLNRVWNDPGTLLIARGLVMIAAPHLAPLIGKRLD